MRTAALALLLAAPAAPSAAQGGEAQLEVVALPEGSARLVVDERSVTLGPGDRALTLGPEHVVTVKSGSIWAELAGTLIKAGAGSSFVFHQTLGGVQIVAGKGSIDLELPDGWSKRLGPGEAYDVATAAAPPPGAPGEPESAAQRRDASSPAGWDPLGAIARAMSGLAAFEKPQLRLMIDLHPFYRLTETYDSNIYLVPPDQADGSRTGGGVLGSWITTHDVGTKVELPFNRRHRLDGVYALHWLAYTQQPKTNNAVNQDFGIDYTYTGIKNVVGRVKESYLNTEDPAFSELTARERRFQNTLSASVESRRSRSFVWTVDGQHSMHKYLSPALAALLNRFEASGGGSLGVLVQPKTRAYAAYHLGRIHYSAGRSNHSRTHRFDLGVDGRLTSKMSGKVQAGAQLREHEVAPSGTDKSEAFFQTQVQLAYKPREPEEVTLRVFRDVNETTFGTNRYYVATGASVGASRTFRRATVNVFGSIEVDRYPDPTTSAGTTGLRRDDLYGGGAGLDFRVRPWLSCGIGYQRLERRSIFSGQFNYTDDRTSVNLRLTF
ncbi:MAG: outer membrane beta-barrel protein [Elusimicrobia bacterium]|nr:outer membrane beta-barrel protein [Elusimicrobiota bacterium]